MTLPVIMKPNGIVRLLRQQSLRIAQLENNATMQKQGSQLRTDYAAIKRLGDRAYVAVMGADACDGERDSQQYALQTLKRLIETQNARLTKLEIDLVYPSDSVNSSQCDQPSLPSCCDAKHGGSSD